MSIIQSSRGVKAKCKIRNLVTKIIIETTITNQ